MPPHLREFLGNRATIGRVLPCETTNRGSVAAQRAWLEVHSAVDAEFKAAEAKYQASITPQAEVTPISPRNAAGIAAEPLRQLLNAGDNGQITQEMEDLLASVTLQALQGVSSVLKNADVAQAEQAKANVTELLLRNTLSQLDITPNQQSYQQIQKRLFGYLPMLENDLKKREEGDFGPGAIETKAPPLPERQVTWEQLVEAWQLDAGGVRDVDGIGITKDRIKRYWRVIGEIKQSSGKAYPCEITIADARKYVQELQKSTKAIRSQQHRVGILQRIYKIAIQYGYTDTNPFVSMTIRSPKGSEQGTYRPFTHDELTVIFNHIKHQAPNEKSLTPLVLLVTGARI